MTVKTRIRFFRQYVCLSIATAAVFLFSGGYDYLYGRVPQLCGKSTLCHDAVIQWYLVDMRVRRALGIGI